MSNKERVRGVYRKVAKIVFKIPSVLNKGQGEKKVDLTAESLSDAFSKVAEQMGEDFKRRVLEQDGTPRSLVNIYVNGKNTKFSGGMEAKLNDGDEIYLLPAVAGGEKSSENTSENTGGNDDASKPVADLSSKDLDRYSRQVMLEEIGYEGQIQLRNASVCVVGAGGLGNPIASRLVAMGVGRIRLVDRDVIELSNLHRQTLFDESDVGKIKVEAAAEKLQKMNSEVKVEALPISVNDYTALDVIEGCDVVIDALDSVNARYALNKACVQSKIPFVTGAAVGVSGQVFTVLSGESACYYCMFPALDEDAMPTCSLEGVHPSILSIVGGIEVAEAVKVILGKRPSLSDKIMHIDLETMDFVSTKTMRVPECPICGIAKEKQLAKASAATTTTSDSMTTTKKPHEELIVEELCGRGGGKRTFAVTPTYTFELDAQKMTELAKQKGFIVENQGELGLSMRTNEMAVNFMKRGSAVIVGPKDESEAISLYTSLAVNAKAEQQRIEEQQETLVSSN